GVHARMLRPDTLSRVGEASGDSAAAGLPLVLLDPVPLDVVGVGDRQGVGAAVGGLADAGELVEGVVAVKPGLLSPALALLGQVALVVVAVREHPVIGHPVARAGLVAGHGPVAVEVVAVRAAVAGQLAG